MRVGMAALVLLLAISGSLQLAAAAGCEAPESLPRSQRGNCTTCVENKCQECVQLRMGRGFHATEEGYCTPCPDFNCGKCSTGSGACEVCLEGYELDAAAPGTCKSLPTDAPPAVNQTGEIKLDMAPRIQYLIGDGYCAEEAMQMTAMYHGVWIPQLWVREYAGHSVVPGYQYEQVLRDMHINYVPFTGKGYAEFVAFAKGWLWAGVPVITIAYIPDEPEPYYDHVESLIGLKSASLDGYDPEDSFILNTGVDLITVTRKVGSFNDTRKGCSDDKGSTLEEGGCVPTDTSLGYAVRGVTYQGDKPHVQLVTDEGEEPTVEGEDTPSAPEEWKGAVKLSGLEAGKSYTVYKMTDAKDVPADAATPLDTSKAAWSKTITATADTASVPVEWNSGVPAWWIALPAAAA